MRKITTTVLLGLIALALIVPGVACGDGESKKVTVGNKNFTEEYIIGQLMKQLLEDRGFDVSLASDLTSDILRTGMEAGDIDICADYTGTAWMVYLGHEYEPGIDNNELYSLVKQEEEGNDFIWLNPIWNNNTYALASWPEFTAEHGLVTLSDLAALYRQEDGKVDTFINFEFSARPDGMPALERHYDFEVDEGSLMTAFTGGSLQALAEHQVDVAMAFGTDAAITKYGWHVYLDDQSFFPPYDLTPYVRQATLDEYPEIADILNELVDTFPGGSQPATPEIVAQGQAVWQELNAKVDIEKMEPDEVAREYLLEHGLIQR
jgi:osmoprotectant transport system substrate-binding protein